MNEKTKEDNPYPCIDCIYKSTHSKIGCIFKATHSKEDCAYCQTWAKWTWAKWGSE